jgi:hypothetical protein
VCSKAAKRDSRVIISHSTKFRQTSLGGFNSKTKRYKELVIFYGQSGMRGEKNQKSENSNPTVSTRHIKAPEDWQKEAIWTL